MQVTDQTVRLEQIEKVTPCRFPTKVLLYRKHFYPASHKGLGMRIVVQSFVNVLAANCGLAEAITTRVTIYGAVLLIATIVEVIPDVV